MFAKNSRYFRLPESSPVNAAGEHLRGKNLRLIPPVTGTFLHRVQSQDRLDLLAVKYYRDPTKWWQICDANPAFEFPLDLLDRSPIQEEIFTLANPAATLRFQATVGALSEIAQVSNQRATFSECAVTVLDVVPAVRIKIIALIQANGLRYLRSFAWSDGMTEGELFRFEDRSAKQDWRLLMEDLVRAPGVQELESAAEDGQVRLVYNSAVTRRENILRAFSVRGYEAVAAASQSLTRTAAAIVVPPNQSI